MIEEGSMIVGVGRARHGKMMQAETPTERERQEERRIAELGSNRSHLQ